MRHHAFRPIFLVTAAVLLGLTFPAAGGARAEEAPVKLGFVTFMTGPAAAPFGIPDRNAAELLIDALNAGKLPAPYGKSASAAPRSRQHLSTKAARRRCGD